jgi:hypothetical protein
MYEQNPARLSPSGTKGPNRLARPNFLQPTPPCVAAAGAVKAEVQDPDELALCVVIPAPRGLGAHHQVDVTRAAKIRSINDDLSDDIPASVRRYKGYVSRRRPGRRCRTASCG